MPFRLVPKSSTLDDLELIEKSFELTAETKYGGTVTNVKRKRVPRGESSYSKTTRAKVMWADTWDSQQTTV